METRRLGLTTIAVALTVSPVLALTQSAADSVWLLWTTQEGKAITSDFPDGLRYCLLECVDDWDVLAAYPSYQHCEDEIPKRVEQEASRLSKRERLNVQSTNNGVSYDDPVLVNRAPSGGLALNSSGGVMLVFDARPEDRVDLLRWR